MKKQQKSPSERITWQHERSSFTAALSPMLHRGKKRARSSSPTSSPSHPSPNTPVVNVKKLQQALRSPHADPTLELWDRFSLSGVSKTPLGIANPTLAHLMVSSSPRPTKAAAGAHGENTLRRAISCGTNWPKRRRVDKAGVQSPSTRMMELARGDSKTSMVTALLETVNDELIRSDSPDARGPTPESRPLKERGIRSPRRPIHETDPRTAGVVSRCDVEIHEGDFEDDFNDDFDDELLLELDASFPAEAGEASPTAAAAATKQNKVNLTADWNEATADEFGDLDDDVFAAAEQFVSQVEAGPAANDKIRHINTPVHQKPQARVFGGGTDDSDDLYGDDFGGDFDFEAAEIAATQSVKSLAASASLSNVRIRP